MSARVIARDQSLTPSRYCCGDADMSGQLPAGSGWSMPSHGDAGGALGARVTELHGDLRGAYCVHEIDDALPSVALRVVPQARDNPA